MNGIRIRTLSLNRMIRLKTLNVNGMNLLSKGEMDNERILASSKIYSTGRFE